MSDRLTCWPAVTVLLFAVIEGGGGGGGAVNVILDPPVPSDVTKNGPLGMAPDSCSVATATLPLFTMSWLLSLSTAVVATVPRRSMVLPFAKLLIVFEKDEG